jgi:ketosteroid isomerase-like protein
MRNLLLFASLAFLLSCGTGGSEQTMHEDHSMEAETPKAIGFNTVLPDLKFHLGTEEAIQVVKDFDKKWEQEDYDGMRSLFADTAVMYFPDGKVAKSGDEAIAMIQAEDDGESTEVSWTFDYAFSVDLDPTRGGEHVQAGFTVTESKDGEKTMKKYHESYYIIEGKIVSLSQYTIEGIPEE